MPSYPPLLSVFLLTPLIAAAAGSSAPAAPPREASFKLPGGDRPGNPTQVFLAGTDSLTILVTASGDSDGLAVWRAFDARGRPQWTTRQRCPDLFGPPGQLRSATLLSDERVIVCEDDYSLAAVDTKTGKERWYWPTKERLNITAMAQGRVATSANNEALLVFDVATGALTRRYKTGGAVLEAVAPSPSGPVALLVQDPPDGKRKTVQLPVGPGGETITVTVSDPDPDRRLIAMPLTGDLPLPDGFPEITPSWSVPFPGYSFNVSPSGPAVVTEPIEGVRVAWEVSSGAELWRHAVVDDEVAAFGEDGGLVVMPTPNGWVMSAIEARTGAPLWHGVLPSGHVPQAAAVGRGDVGILTDKGLLLYRFADGTPIADVAREEDQELVLARSTPNLLSWMTQGALERVLHFMALSR